MWAQDTGSSVASDADSGLITRGQRYPPIFLTMMALVELGRDIVMTEEDRGFVAHCQNPDVASDGRTPMEALANLREALELYFEDSDCR